MNGANGFTKYYEYGRYDQDGLGRVQGVVIPNARIVDKSVSPESLVAPLRKLATSAGKGSRIEGVYIEVEAKFGAMVTYAESRKMANTNPRREPYDILSNSCIHFAKSVARAAGVATPWMIDPRPNSYIGEFRSDFPDLDYSPKTNELIIEGVGEF